jgi:hypothetical protein
MKLTVNELENWAVSPVLEEDIRKQIGILLSAINDWPTSISTVEEFELEIRNIVGEKLDPITLKKFEKRADTTKHAWQMESIAQLLDLFQYYDNPKICFEEIIADLRKKIKCL